MSDRVRAAWQQALDQGRSEIASRLLLCSQAIDEEEAAFPDDRRGDEAE